MRAKQYRHNAHLKLRHIRSLRRFLPHHEARYFFSPENRGARFIKRARLTSAHVETKSGVLIQPACPPTLTNLLRGEFRKTANALRQYGYGYNHARFCSQTEIPDQITIDPECVMYVGGSPVWAPDEYLGHSQTHYFETHQLKTLLHSRSYSMDFPLPTTAPMPKPRSRFSQWWLSKSAKGRDILHHEHLEMKHARRQAQIFEIIQALPYMDPDSTRFVEYIWMTRQHAGRDTGGGFFDISADLNADFKKIRELFKDECEVVYTSDHLFRGIEFDDEGVIRFYVVADCTTNGQISINMFGDEEKVDDHKAYLEENYRPPATITIRTLNGFGAHGAEESEDTIFENQSDFGLDEFYPFIEGGVDNLIEEYKKSKSSVIVLIGPPGTGKTTLLRTLMFRMGRKNIAHCSSKDALENPSLISWVTSVGKDAIVGIEDADAIVRKRADGNSQMSSLLSYADGVIKHNNKMVIATNLDNTDQVDPALVRPGRAFRVIVFRKLTGEEINRARTALGKSPIDAYRDMTLSEVINHEDVPHLEQSKGEENGFGFHGAANRQSA